MTNKQVIDNFIGGRMAKSLSLKSEGNKLFSYDTCIAQMTVNSIIVNMTSYSVTTSKHRTLLLREIRYRHHIVEVNDVPIEAQDLTKYVKE